MEQKYEYKFVRLGGGLFGARGKAQFQYRNVIEEYARDGWRLVQVFAPCLGAFGASTYIEVILERQIG